MNTISFVKILEICNRYYTFKRWAKSIIRVWNFYSFVESLQFIKRVQGWWTNHKLNRKFGLDRTTFRERDRWWCLTKEITDRIKYMRCYVPTVLIFNTQIHTHVYEYRMICRCSLFIKSEITNKFRRRQISSIYWPPITFLFILYRRRNYFENLSLV